MQRIPRNVRVTFRSMMSGCELVHTTGRPPAAARAVVFLFAGAFVFPALMLANDRRQTSSALGFGATALLVFIVGLALSVANRWIYFDPAKRELIVVVRGLLGSRARNIPLAHVRDVELSWDPNRSARGWRLWIHLANGERIFYTVTGGSWRAGQSWTSSPPLEEYRRLQEIVGRPFTIRQ
jgi:hypothetical protein